MTEFDPGQPIYHLPSPGVPEGLHLPAMGQIKILHIVDGFGELM